MRKESKEIKIMMECRTRDTKNVRGPAWLSGKVVDLQSRGPGFEPHWILWVFRGSFFGQDTSEPSLLQVKPRKDMNNVSFRRNMTEILLKAA